MLRKVLAFAAVVLGLSSCVLGQAPPPRPLDPSIIIDEQLIPYLPYERVPYPEVSWAQARACLRILGTAVIDTQPPPDLIVVPFAKLGVHDLTRDSLYGYRPYYNPMVGPFIAYSLLHSNVVIILERYATNAAVLRHEAIHFMMWRSHQSFGHEPPGLYQQCGDNYENVIAQWAP